ncbi:MAG: DUF6789 family protein [Pseudorhodoplanes sp.]|uniref:DUF6789 family protein n=1 Tax=Pseudorhodoplanes sp. TaxID=1934341 RepID=UPI003D0E3BD7
MTEKRIPRFVPNRRWVWKTAIAGLCGMAAHWTLMYFKSRSGLLPTFNPYASFQGMLSRATGEAVGPLVPWALSFLNGFIVISLVFRLVYRRLPGGNGGIKGIVYGFLGWGMMNVIFFPLLGLGVFATNTGLGVWPALFSLAMVQTYSIVMGLVYDALNERFG